MKLGLPAWGFLASRIDQRIAVSERARDSAARWLPGEYEIVPNGVLIPDGVDPAGREHTVTFAGRQETRKGLQVLLRAWPEIHRRTGARLQICGSDPLAVRLLLTRLRVSDDGIDILGFLPQEELTSLLARTKALVAPSLGGESFGMVLTRAFACALPVVASDIPGYREVTTPETSVTIPPDDTVALTDAIVGSARRRAASRRDGRAARELAIEQYAWSDIARRLEGHLRARHRGRRAARGMSRMAAVRPQSVGARPLRARDARRRDRRDLVARAGLDNRLPRVRRRLLALGDRRDPAQPPLRARALALVAADDRPGPARAASPLRPGLLRLRDRAARECRPPGPGGRVRARRRPAAAPPARARDERDPARHRLRPPPLRPLPRRDPRHLGPADGEDPALGRHEPHHLRARRLRPADDRPALRPHRRGADARRHGEPPGARDHGAGRGSRSCAGRCRRSGRPRSSASAG